MSSDPLAVVFDCVVFAQALINPDGPAGECVKRARSGGVRLFISEYVVGEIRELYRKIPDRYAVTAQQINDLADDVCVFGVLVLDVPSVYIHPIDPDDSAYVDLAIATGAALIVSRDRHLLNLMDTSRPDGQEFTKLFPSLKVLTPNAMLTEVVTQSEDD